MERAKINISKSDILRYNTPDVKIDSWELCNSEIKETNSTVHLGMTRNTNESIDIDKMIQTGRQTLYSLFGAGLHGRNGLNPKIAKHIWSTYVIPRLIYGLEIQHVTDTQIQKLNQFQIKSLKQLQWLPSRCSNAAVYLLLGAEPIQATINKRMLSLFGQIIGDQNLMENKIAYRQIAIYDLNSKSWFSKFKMVLMKYGLPEAFHLLQNPPKKKLEWKTMVDKKVNQFWIDSLVEDNNSKKLIKSHVCKHMQNRAVPPSIENSKTKSNRCRKGCN
jgi:hypothetical protein